VQNKIVDLLNKKTDLIDQTIEKKKKLIELLHEKRTAIINQAVTKGLDPKAELVDSGVEWIGKIPAGWRVMPFKIGVRFQEGPGIMAPDFMEDGVPLLRVRNLKAGFVSLKNCNFLDQKKVDATWKHFLLKNGDLLISASATMGIVSEVDSRSEGSIAYTGIIRLIPIGGISVKDYIKFFVISKVYNTQIDVLHAGTAMQHYGPSHLKKIFCILPPTILQIEIAKYLNLVTKDIDQLIKITDDSVKLLQEFKMSLISNAVTGKIKI
jgi:type I restriction enzyme S subunit